MAIDMVHPAPVRMIRNGARKESIALVPMRTRVEIREVDPTDIPRVCVLVGDQEWHAFHAHGGALWLQVAGTRYDWKAAPSDPGSVADFLAGQLLDSEYAHADFTRAMAGGPLVGPLVHNLRRDDTADLARARVVVDDAREESVGVAKRWAEERIVLAGGKVYVRAPNPMAVLGTNGDCRSLQPCAVNAFPLHWRTHDFRSKEPTDLAKQLRGFPVRLDRLADFQGALVPRGLVKQPGRQLAALQSQVSADLTGLLDDDDLVLMANVLPGAAVREIEGMLATGRDWDGSTEALDALPELRRHELRGTVGMIGIEAAEAVVELVAGVARRGASPVFEAMSLWSDTFALPRLRARSAKPTPSEDLGPISALAL